MTARIRSRAVAGLTGWSLRTVQEKALAGAIPSGLACLEKVTIPNLKPEIAAASKAWRREGDSNPR
jgi:hypothetical protein